MLLYVKLLQMLTIEQNASVSISFTEVPNTSCTNHEEDSVCAVQLSCVHNKVVVIPQVAKPAPAEEQLIGVKQT
ncbi:hypothetical protein J1605_011108 [Eschrichtius robustus]|uniref:Uncharacterized protein n=1 Tax=Eschrichtius robustus TaxID=9764 RepID=A0AB34GNL7_ESCRO|nr:hypothetical protein J1605_011108 [Eschrichtius robustus]